MVCVHGRGGDEGGRTGDLKEQNFTNSAIFYEWFGLRILGG